MSEVVKLVGGGSVINRATLSSFFNYITAVCSNKGLQCQVGELGNHNMFLPGARLATRQHGGGGARRSHKDL